VQVSLIETEKLLSKMMEERLYELKQSGQYKGSFSTLHHFFGYEGRCAAPSNFDADYAYGLGTVASLLIGYGKRGYVACLQDLHKPVSDWRPCGIPLTSMMNMERRHGKDKPVIKKALVELDGKPFEYYSANREEWAKTDSFIFPGPIQYFGPSNVCDRQPTSLLLEKGL
jgi:pyrophosphate--fructose-6-phosphate 1-phosphotransferase